jgi:hypothetical protein
MGEDKQPKLFAARIAQLMMKSYTLFTWEANVRLNSRNVGSKRQLPAEKDESEFGSCVV